VLQRSTASRPYTILQPAPTNTARGDHARARLAHPYPRPVLSRARRCAKRHYAISGSSARRGAPFDPACPFFFRCLCLRLGRPSDGAHPTYVANADADELIYVH